MTAFTKLVSVGIIASICIVALLRKPAQARTTQVLCVNPNGDSGCVSTISAAVALITAKKVQINVTSGSYSDTVAINTSANPSKLTLSIIGSGADFVTVTGQGSSVFTVGPKATVTLMGMTIARGSGQPIPSGSSAGGGVFASNSKLTITQCTIDENQADLGAGIYAFNTTLNITSSAVIDGNTSSATSSEGGSIYFGAGKASKLTINDAIIGGSSASNGGGIMLSGSGKAKPSAVISNTTIYANSATASGAGVLVQNAKLTMINSTLSGNSSSGQGGGLMSTADASVVLNNVTISANNATGSGGGIEIDSSNKKFTFSNTIIAGNTAANAPDCSASSSKPASSNDYNLVGDATGCAIIGRTSHNQTGDSSNPLDPLLAPLADNGGGPAPDYAPQTQALMIGSPALGTGNPAIPNGRNGHCELTDETGLLGSETRTKGDCDIGAYQLPD
jgi:hypothetical protein